MDHHFDEHQHDYRKVFKAAFGEGPLDPQIMELIKHVHRTYNVVDSAFDEFMKPYGLTTAKSRLLMWLLACDKIGYEDGLLPSQLSRFQGVSPNTVSALLAGLQDQGLIQRSRHATDHRKQIIKITDTGRDLIKNMGNAYVTFVKSTMDGLSPEEREILITLLHKLTVSVQKATETAHTVVCEGPQ